MVTQTQCSFKSLKVPFCRSDLIMLRKAAKEDWDIGAEEKPQLVEYVLATRDADGATDRTKKSCEKTLAAFHEKGWSK